MKMCPQSILILQIQLLHIFKMQKPNFILVTIFTLALFYWINISPSKAWGSKQQKHMREKNRKSLKGFKLRPDTDTENVLQPRIVGGAPVNWGEAPYYLRMEYTFRKSPFVCGACLMNYRGLRFAVTAAHCLWWGDKNQTDIWAATVDPQYVELVGADIDKDAYNPREQRFHADGALIHQEFDPRTTANDIGLVFMKEYAFESLGLERVPGPKEGWLDPNYSTVVGHGAKLRFDNQRFLQKVELETFPRDVCNQGLIQIWNRTLPDTQYCLIHPKLWVNQGICYGDSGGPVVAYNYSIQRWYLAGVVSYSSVISCGTPGVFSIATKVTHYVPWIKKHADIWIAAYGTGNQYVNGTPDDSDIDDLCC